MPRWPCPWPHRGYVLETGRVVTTGTGEELIESPEIKKSLPGRVTYFL